MARDPNIFSGKNFIGNMNPNPNMVHDLNREKEACQIDEILVGHIKTFDPDTLDQAEKEDFKACDKCLPDEQDVEIEL